MQAHAPAQMGMKQAGIAAHPSGPKAFFLEAPSPTVQFCKLLISEPLIIPEFRRSEKHSKRTQRYTVQNWTRNVFPKPFGAWGTTPMVSAPSSILTLRVSGSSQEAYFPARLWSVSPT